MGLYDAPAELDVAHSIAFADCMRKAGFDLPLDLSVGEDQAMTNLVGLGLFPDEETARASGYPTSLNGQTDQESNPAANYQASLSPDQAALYTRAAEGTPGEVVTYTLPGSSIGVSRPKSGCVAEADTRVFGSVKASMELQNFPNEVAYVVQTSFSFNDTSFSDLMDTYSQCMAGAGYVVEGIGGTRELAMTQFGASRAEGEPLSAEEQSLAVSDYRCQTESTLATRLNDLFFESSRAWAIDNEARILQFYDDQRSALERSKAIIEDGSN